MEDFAPVVVLAAAPPPAKSSSNLSAFINRAGLFGKFNRCASDRFARMSGPVLVDSVHEDLLFGGSGKPAASATNFGSRAGGAGAGAGNVIGGNVKEDLFFGGSGTGTKSFGSGGTGSVNVRASVGGPPNFTTSLFASQTPSVRNYDDFVRTPAKVSTSANSSSLPVFDAPIYDDDSFGGAYHDIFNVAFADDSRPSGFKDLRGRSKGAEQKAQTFSRTNSMRPSPLNSDRYFGQDPAADKSLPGFGSSEAAQSRSAGDGMPPQWPGFGNDAAPRAKDKPLRVSRSYSVVHTPSLSELNPFNLTPFPSDNTGMKSSSNGLSEAVSGFEEISPSTPPASFIKSMRKVSGPVKRSETESASYKESAAEEYFVKRIHEGNIVAIDRPKHLLNTVKPEADIAAKSSVAAASPSTIQSEQRLPQFESVSRPAQCAKLQKSRNADEFWITVDNVKLMTKRSSVNPPLRSPPMPTLKPGTSKLWKEAKGNVVTSPVPDEDLADTSTAAAASAAAMKEAMERAAMKLKLAKEAREKERERRENESKATKFKDEKEQAQRAREGGDKERKANDAWETCQSEEKEKEGSRKREANEWLHKERGRETGREREREWEKHRVAFERATQDAWERGEGPKYRAERSATEVHERAERIAVERATAEARERAAAERERAAVERAVAEARSRAERAAVDRATEEARERAALRSQVERAATEARDRAERVAAAVRKQQRRNENDFDSFFMGSSQESSTPRQRPTATDASLNVRQTNKSSSNERQQRSSIGAVSVNKKESTTSTADDQTLFSFTDKFQEIEGETPERRRARWEYYQRTHERAAKALQEKNQRDLQNQMEQAERYRASETLDAVIKRWAAGKEGNLRALLSNLHSVLWPECGWQPVSVMDLFTTEAVKKAYRKATLCVHPDKVQQKGATIHQKYMAEKLFDLLKDAWNKFHSEEVTLRRISS